MADSLRLRVNGKRDRQDVRDRRDSNFRVRRYGNFELRTLNSPRLARPVFSANLAQKTRNVFSGGVATNRHE
jgi:hypothetical protein